MGDGKTDVGDVGDGKTDRFGFGFGSSKSSSLELPGERLRRRVDDATDDDVESVSSISVSLKK